jgi:anaerobic ribonucleoside-triphosphate reductase activating protein
VTRVAINKIHWPVMTLGAGRRLGIWFQGCSIGCPGCLSLDTWDTPEETWTTVQRVLEAVDAPLREGLNGVTISGGEPFDQPLALLELVRGLRALIDVGAGDESERELDILCYSGRPLGQLRSRYQSVLAELDAVISDPFSKQRPTLLPWRGSDNQRLTLLSGLARSRYTPDVISGGQTALQFDVSDDGIWMIGVPREGDLERVEQRLAAAGVTLGEVSWRS